MRTMGRFKSRCYKCPFFSGTAGYKRDLLQGAWGICPLFSRAGVTPAYTEAGAAEGAGAGSKHTSPGPRRGWVSLWGPGAPGPRQTRSLIRFANPSWHGKASLLGRPAWVWPDTSCGGNRSARSRGEEGALPQLRGRGSPCCCRPSGETQRKLRAQDTRSTGSHVHGACHHAAGGRPLE